MTKYSNKYIRFFLSQLLHPSKSVDISFFSNENIFWDKFVKLASADLLLPSVYCSIRDKKLDKYVPSELLIYLKNITKLNYDRNKQILKQVKFLSNLFKKNNLNHVFLKGASLIISKPNEMLESRMIGDIDILFFEKEVNKAQNLLIKKGFKEVFRKKSDDLVFSQEILNQKKRHLHRLSHINHIAAVEIHRRLLDFSYDNLLNANEVLKNKIITCDGYSIPSKIHQWEYAILNWQYNDYGMLYNNLSFRPVIDVLHLEPDEIKTKIIKSHGAIAHFYSLMSVYYNHYPVNSYFKRLLYLSQISSKPVFIMISYWANLKYLLSIIFSRLNLIIKSKKYRIRVLSNLSLVWSKLLNVKLRK